MRSLSKLCWFWVMLGMCCVVMGDGPFPITATNNISDIVVNVAIQNPSSAPAQGDVIQSDNAIVITNMSLQKASTLTNVTLAAEISTRLQTNGVLISIPYLQSSTSGTTNSVIRLKALISSPKNK